MTFNELCAALADDPTWQRIAVELPEEAHTLARHDAAMLVARYVNAALAEVRVATEADEATHHHTRMFKGMVWAEQVYDAIDARRIA